MRLGRSGCKPIAKIMISREHCESEEKMQIVIKQNFNHNKKLMKKLGLGKHWIQNADFLWCYTHEAHTHVRCKSFRVIHE